MKIAARIGSGRRSSKQARTRWAFAEALEGRLLLSSVPDNQNQTPTGWAWYTGVDANTLNGAINQGYRIVDLSVDQASPLLFNAALVQNTGSYSQGWWWYYNETPSQLAALPAMLGARITDVEPYFVSGQLEFAALLAPNTGADAKGWWWYYGDSQSDITNQLNQNNARLVDLKSYVDGGVQKYAAVMISNTGADNRAWWYYYDQTPSQISASLNANQARLVQLEPVDAGHFDVIMQQDAGIGWWWYYGVDLNTLGKIAQQNGARIFNVESYLDSGGNTKLAAILINNSDAVTTTVGNILRGASSTASTGLYLKQVAGPVLESLQADTQFEPASMIKAVLNLTAMRAVQAGTISLNTNLWMYYNPANPYVDFNNPGNPNENPDAYADTTSNRVSLPLGVILARMMEISDNRATKAIDVQFGRPTINAVAQLAGMTNTVFASTLGSGVPGNFLTLDDAGKLYEGVLNHTLLNAANAAQFFDNMSDQPDPGGTEAIPIGDSIFGPFQTDVTEEAANILGLPQNNALVTSLSNAFIAQMRGAWKGGSYTLGAANSQWALDLTAGGYLGLPFEDAAGNINLQNYLYGIFINNALVPQSPFPNPQSNAVNNAWSQSQQELLRSLIHQALATWHVNPHVVVTNLNDSGAGSLRAATQLADNSVGTTTITFAGGLTGAIHLTSGQLELSNSVGNTDIVGPGAQVITITGGGATRVLQVDAGVTATVSGLTITGGSGESGGGINDAGTLSLDASAISGNTASKGGGGINVANGASLSLINSTISNNLANFGGGISDQGTLNASNSTIAGNAAQTGAGIYDSGVATLRNLTIAANHATTSGGGLLLSGGSATIDNTIIAQNTIGGTNAPDDIVGNVAAGSVNNLIGTGGSGGLGNSSGNIVGVANPGLRPLGYYGGPTQTMALLTASPAIDHGSNAQALTPNGQSLLSDQRDYLRIVNGTVDIGAFEFLQGDANYDGKVGFDDLVIVARNYGKSNATWEQGDFDGDGKVDFSDLVIVARNYGRSDIIIAVAGLAPTVPELLKAARHRRR